MGLLDYYRQFEEQPPEEVSAELRERAAARRREALSRVEPLDLSVLTWPQLPPSVVVNAVTYVARRGLHRYRAPHAAELGAELAHRLGVPDARVVVGHGAAQLLGSAAAALLEPGDELVTPWPSYPLLPVLARRAGGAAVAVEPGSVLAALTDRTRIVALCNPNDPTGAWLDEAALRGLLGALPERVVVLLDEALVEYAPSSAAGLVDEFPRLLVFRSFSKAWGLAGLRIGYAVGGPGSEPLLERLEPELGVNELATAGALEALRATDALVARRVATVRATRDRLAGELTELGLAVAPSEANLLWVAAGRHDGAQLAHELDTRAKIRVAEGGRLGDPARIRVAVHDDAAADRLRDALAAILRG